eukprot:2223506-Pyramimonas_sp.AAC.1
MPPGIRPPWEHAQGPRMRPPGYLRLRLDGDAIRYVLPCHREVDEPAFPFGTCDLHVRCDDAASKSLREP